MFVSLLSGNLLGEQEKEHRMGITDKISGRAKQAVGDITGDADTKQQGRKEERKGDVKDEAAQKEEEASQKRAEAADLAAYIERQGR